MLAASRHHVAHYVSILLPLKLYYITYIYINSYKLCLEILTVTMATFLLLFRPQPSVARFSGVRVVQCRQQWSRWKSAIAHRTRQESLCRRLRDLFSSTSRLCNVFVATTDSEYRVKLTLKCTILTLYHTVYDRYCSIVKHLNLLPIIISYLISYPLQ